MSKSGRKRYKKYQVKGNESRTAPSSCKVFVGNISYRIKEDELAEFFSSEFGPVHFTQIVKDHRKGWSRGIGFVTFFSAESAKLALDASEEQLVLDGRTLRVSVPHVPKRQQVVSVEPKMGGDKPVTSGDLVTLSASEHVAGVGISRTVILNDDVLFQVFSYLSLKDRIRAEMVCAQWRQVARRWWKSVRQLNFDQVFVSFKGSDLSDEILASILSRGCQELRSLDVSASPTRLTDYSLHLIGLHCHKLRDLNISRVNVTPQSLKRLTQQCSALKVLIARGCHNVGEKSLWWALHHCRELEQLDVSHNRRLNGQCFYMSVPTLCRLSLCECAAMTDDGIELLAKNSPNLHSLNISKCQLLTGKSLRSLARVSAISYSLSKGH